MKVNRSCRAGIAGALGLGLLASASCFAQSGAREPRIDGSSAPVDSQLAGRTPQSAQ
jgi:hypothetical protein